MEWKESEDARYSELLTSTPVDTPVNSEDDATNQRTGASPEGEGLSAVASPGLRWREAYCLLVWVTHNVDSVSALDAKVPDYVGTEVIARDICTYWVGAPANTFTIELLSDTEFLLFEGPWSGLGITWENGIAYTRILHDIPDWGGMDVTMVASQCTMKQSRIDLANTREYCQAHILGWLAAVEGKAWSLAVKNTKTAIPQGRGQGYTRRADHYFAQKVVGPCPGTYPACTKACNPRRLPLPQEPSEFRDWRVPVLPPQDTPLLLWRHLITTLTIPNAVIPRIETRNTGNRSIMTSKKVARPMLLFWESTKEGALTYADWKGEVEEYITKGYSGQKIKDATFTPWKAKLRGTTRLVTRRVTWSLRKS